MLNSLRPDMSQYVRNWVWHAVKLKKCVQNNGHFTGAEAYSLKT